MNTIFGLDDVQRFVERGARDFADVYSDHPLVFVTGPVQHLPRQFHGGAVK